MPARAADGVSFRGPPKARAATVPRASVIVTPRKPSLRRSSPVTIFFSKAAGLPLKAG